MLLPYAKQFAQSILMDQPFPCNLPALNSAVFQISSDRFSRYVKLCREFRYRVDFHFQSFRWLINKRASDPVRGFFGFLESHKESLFPSRIAFVRVFKGSIVAGHQMELESHGWLFHFHNPRTNYPAFYAVR